MEESVEREVAIQQVVEALQGTSLCEEVAVAEESARQSVQTYIEEEIM